MTRTLATLLLLSCLAGCNTERENPDPVSGDERNDYRLTTSLPDREH